MAKMIFELDNKLEEKFRKTVADVKGLHKGVIRESLEEAIQEWMDSRIKSKVKKHE
jgi:hypothetical protein